MKAAFLLFARLMLRPLAREPIRAALTVLAVALGVAMVVAIDLASQAATSSFHSSLESLAGPNDLVITATGGVKEDLLGKLVQLPFAFEFTPRITDFALVNGKGEAIPFIGIDFIGANFLGNERQQQAVNPSPEQEAQLLGSVSSVWVGNRLGFRPGDHIHLLINDRMREFKVEGILRSPPGQNSEQNVIVADIGLAQEVTGKIGSLDRIDVRIPPDRSLESWQQILRDRLPISVSVEREGSRTDENRKMLSAFRLNLRVLSCIALIVGAFLIYNTISVSVVRRRNEIGVLRALGATRQMIAAGFLAESLFFACVGTLLGLMIGRIMAIAAVQLIGNTVESLYISSQPAPIMLTSGSVVTGVCLGLAISILAALAPAIDASRVAPFEAMARGREEYVATIRSRAAMPWAALLIVAAALLAQLPPVNRQPLFAYLSVVFLIAGTAMLIPSLVSAFAGLSQHFPLKLAGVEALLAMRSLRASPGRTSVLTAALATAVAMTASVGIMVGSFRETVRLWMDNQLQADLYVGPAGRAGADRHPTMAPDIADRIERLPEVTAVDRFRAYSISYGGLPATLAASEASRLHNWTKTRFLPGEHGDRILSRLPQANYAIVSEPFANKHGVEVGDIIELPLAGSVRSFKVLGIYYDYSTERGIILLDRRTLLKYLPDPAPSNIAVYLSPGADRDQVRRAINDVIGTRRIAVVSNGALRKGAMAIFDRTFRITYALEAVAITVAVMGIAGALLAMVIDRRREFALLRFLGGAQAQIQHIILAEAAFLGLLSNAIGFVLGAVLSLILIFVINKQSFGWTFQLHWPVALLFAALTGIYIATLLAALYPARTAMHMNPIEALHEE